VHTLKEIYDIVSNTNARLDATASVEKTGQTTSYATGDDGDLMKGVAWPDPRFTDNGNGTVTDNLTGLIWLKNANCFGTRLWTTGLSDCNSLASGSCGLTDGSVAGDWRMPNIKELLSLIDYGYYDKALPAGHPFTGVMDDHYWSGTSAAHDTKNVWYMDVIDGTTSDILKRRNYYYVWPVRGGN
jgi:hypothetical protein